MISSHWSALTIALQTNCYSLVQPIASSCKLTFILMPFIMNSYTSSFCSLIYVGICSRDWECLTRTFAFWECLWASVAVLLSQTGSLLEEIPAINTAMAGSKLSTPIWPPVTPVAVAVKPPLVCCINSINCGMSNHCNWYACVYSQCLLPLVYNAPSRCIYTY